MAGKKKVEEEAAAPAEEAGPSITVRATAETTFDKNGAGMTWVSADLLLKPNVPCAIITPDGRAVFAGMTGSSGEIRRAVAPFTGPFIIKSTRKDDDTVYAEGVA